MLVKGEIYVFAYDLDAVVVAHPIKPDLIGRRLHSTGKLFRDEIMELAKTEGRRARRPDRCDTRATRCADRLRRQA